MMMLVTCWAHLDCRCRAGRKLEADLVLPPVSRFTAEGGHGEKKQRVIDRLTAFFERFYGLIGVPRDD